MAKNKKKKRSKGGWVKWAKALVVISVIGLLLWLLFANKKYIRRACRYVAHRYYKTNFGPTDFPQAYEVHGIDISHYQEVEDWSKIKAVNAEGDTIHFKFVIIKATEGLLIEDRQFDEYWEDAKDYGLVRGAYHYFLPDRSARVQALNFISSVKLEKGDLPPVVDIEETRGKPKEVIVKQLKEFIASLEKKYKVKPIIYSNINFIEDYLADDFADYPFWIAHYYRTHVSPAENIQWVLWQHSDKGDLLGINGNTDVNVFNGSKEEFDELLLR